MASVNEDGKAIKATSKEFKPMNIQSLVNSNKVQERLKSILGDRAGAFAGSIINVTNSSSMLSKCDPISVVSASMMGAVLNLPIDSNLGFSAVVPYGNKAQFQIMVKGFIQLAQRSGQYKTINVSAIYEDEFNSYDPITEELDYSIKIDGFRDGGREDKIVGYVAYFKLTSGFEKTIYWTVKKIDEHAKKFSKSYSNPNGVWKSNKEAMRAKTVLKALISKWGPLSVDYQMQRAISSDQAVIDIKEDGTETFDYVDNPTETEKIEQVFNKADDQINAVLDQEQKTASVVLADDEELF